MARTLAVLAGAPASALRGEGVDLLGLSKGGATPSRAFPMEAWPPFSQYRWHPLFGITDGRYKWVRGRTDHLYDLSADPGESRDLAAAPPPGALALKAKLAPPPAAAPSEGKVDPALLGLGYAPAPGGRFDPSALPDLYDDKAAILQDIAQARLERDTGQFDEAARHYEKALELQPDFTLALNPLAAHHLDQNELDKASSLLERAVSTGIADFRTYLLRGQIRLAQRRNDDAAKNFEAALRLSAHPERTLKEEADIYMEQQLAEAGQRLYLEGIRRYPTYAPNYLTLGGYFMQMGRPGQAGPLLKKALDCDLDPKTRERVQGTVRKLDAAVDPAGAK